MGCGWKLSVSIDEDGFKENNKVVPEEFIQELMELDESGSTDYGEECFDIFFSASRSFSIRYWARANLSDEVREQIKGLVTFYLYCEDRDPDETYEVD